MKLWSITFCLLFISHSTHSASFNTGPVFSAFGKHAPVEGVALPDDAHFKVAFDVAKGANPGEINRAFESLARFINMHAAAGVAKENLQLALVVHGSATLDVLTNEAYKSREGTNNGNQALIKALQKFGVKIQVCGQSTAAHNVKQSQLIPGVNMALSAMTAHALLQQDGYTLNPW